MKLRSFCLMLDSVKGAVVVVVAVAVAVVVVVAIIMFVLLVGFSPWDSSLFG